jgi:methyl-accepting chemotaxis protein
MTEVINRLVNSSAGLQRAISATGTDFAAAEHSLSERMDYFRSILTNVAGEINQLNQSTRPRSTKQAVLLKRSHATS